MADCDTSFSFGANTSRTESLLCDLNAPQRQAVTHTDGPMLLLAGAGSGKTRVITRRAAHLAATVTQPWHVLSITFTNKAATEMRERMVALGVGKDMTVCTFHALCARLLRIHHQAAGLLPNFTIVDQHDRRKLLAEAIERADLSTANWQPAKMEARISRAKNAMETAETMDDSVDPIERTIGRIYGQYEKVLAEQNGLDFDDLLFKTASLLGRDDDVRRKLADRYRYVQIDEYQDTNTAQYRIARLLTQDHRNLLVTGDPDQSIYAWRGADIENILSFEDDYAETKVIRLEQNYRSTQNILSAASSLIRHNVDRKEKSLWSEKEKGPRVRTIQWEDGTAEADGVVQDIAATIEAGCAPRDLAVFYRVNALSRSLEEALIKTDIPYRIARGVAFYARKEIKDTLAYLRIMVNPADEVSLLRIINTPPRGIGAKTIERLRGFATRRGSNLFEAILHSAECGLDRRAGGCVIRFAELLETLRPLAEALARTALEQALSLSGMAAMLKQQESVDADPAANVAELVNATVEYDRENPEGTLLDWLSYTSLLADDDKIAGEEGAVTLMTLHSAKGLEFPHVYIVGVEDGLLPMRRMDSSGEDIEEERRLFFVGMTRAMQRLTIGHAVERMFRGITTRTLRSQFLDELPVDEIECVDKTQSPRNKRRRTPVGTLPDDIDSWEVGSLVRHPQHGLGQVMTLFRGARRTHVDVLFENGLRRNWVLEFADLQRVEFDEID